VPSGLMIRLRGCRSPWRRPWLLYYASAAGPVGVVVDDFGCFDVRLTGDPASIVAGQATRDGLVPGTLAAAPELREWLRTISNPETPSSAGPG
jgi:hypothetical protein